MKYVIGGFEFNTKKDIVIFVQKILYNYEVGDFINKDDFKFIFALLQNHRWVEDKIGCGIENFKIVLTEYKNRAFNIIRTDGSETDFSFMKCILKPKDWEYHDFVCACRATISPQIQDFKQEELLKTIKCPYRNILLDKTNSHVDHMPPNTFKKIVEDFIKTYEINVKTINVGGHEDNSTSKYFIDEQVKTNFYDFHEQHATLRLVSAQANLSDVKKEN